MNIGDFFGQYNRNGVATTTTNPVQPSAVASLTNTLKQLAIGTIFEGNITRVRGEHVLLSLENGQSIHARLDSSLKLVQGQSMFFQVKSNDGQTVAIRPYRGDGLSNPTLIQALKAAGLPGEERNFQMVDSMMKEKMPIDAESLLGMHKNVVSNPNVSVDTVVQMTRLGMEITPGVASQFEAYKSDTIELLDQFSQLTDEIGGLLTAEGKTVNEALTIQTELLSVLETGMPDEEVIMPGKPESLLDEGDDDIAQDNVKSPWRHTVQASGTGGLLDADNKISGLFDDETVVKMYDGDKNASYFSAAVGDESEFVFEFEDEATGINPNSVGAILTDKESEGLSEILKSIGNMADRPEVFDEKGKLNQNLTAKQLLNYINNEMVLHEDELEHDDVKDVFSNKGYQKLINNLVTSQFTVKPEELKTEDKMKELYSKLDNQIEKLTNVLKMTGNENTNLADTATDIKNNMDFMQQVNQVYQYIQVPLNMNGQNTSADLYVYTNKKRGNQDDNGELSAFLHLDMDNLGSTDCMVKMKDKQVSTNFTFDNDASMKLVEKYLPVLEERLNNLGYNCKVTVSGGDTGINFVEDFLKKDLPTGGGVVHRYSFDVRA